jgi:class 3 adenylate cyclase
MTAERSPGATSRREVRRPLTSVFIDIVGSTPLSVLLDDDVYNAVINEYRDVTNDAVRRHGGTVQHDEGDGRFVWFGWPSAHRDDGDRAVTMALELFDRIGPLSRRVGALADRELGLRVGIHTGPQIVTLPTSSAPSDVQGAAANFAAKVQQRCEPGMVLISEATADVLTKPFELEPHGLVTIDSVPGGIRVYRVIGPGEPPAEVGAFVGRDRELAVLTDRWATVAAGGSASVVLTASAGLGKSRLLSELCTRPDIPLVVRAAGDEHRLEDPLHALVEALAHSGLVADGARPETADDVVDVVVKAAAGGPTLLVVDDAQWLDASSRDVIAELSANPVPDLMLLVAGRPFGGMTGWVDDADRLTLRPLGAEDAATLLESVDDAGALGLATRATIVERSGGNPLFLRWLAKTSVDADFEGVRRILRPRSGVPVVVQQVLRSVLDGSGVDDVTTSMAAAIGNQFDAVLLAAVLGRPQPSVDDDLHTLAAHDIIRRADARRYQFSHALVRDLAYDVLVEDERVRCHARIADTLEELDSSDHALIGYHHDRAGRAVPAARAKVRAARLCRASGAYREGAALTSRALELIAGDAGADHDELELEANELHHLFATVTEPKAYAAGSHATAPQVLDSLDLADRDRRTCIDKTSQWAAACMVGNLQESARLLYDVYRIGARFPAIAPFNRCARGYHATLRGRYAHAERLLRESTGPMLEDGLDPWLAEHWPAPDDPIALGLAYLPIVLLQRGYLRSGIDWLRRAWQRAETLQNGAYSMAHISLNSALLWAAMGNGHAVMDHGRDMTKLGTELDAALWTTLGGVYEQLGVALAYPTAEHVAAVNGLATSFEGFSGPLAIVLYLYGAQSARSAGDDGSAVHMLDGVDRLSRNLGLQEFDAEATRLRAATAAADERARLLRVASGVARRQGARRYRLRALTDLAGHDPLGVTDDGPAAEALRAAVAEIDDQDDDADVMRALSLLPAPAR